MSEAEAQNNRGYTVRMAVHAVVLCIEMPPAIKLEFYQAWSNTLLQLFTYYYRIAKQSHSTSRALSPPTLYEQAAWDRACPEELPAWSDGPVPGRTEHWTAAHRSRQSTGGGRTPGCSCQIVCWADHPDFRRFLRSVELITYWTCSSLLLSSLREMTNFMRLKAAGMSLKATHLVSYRKPVKDWLGEILSWLIICSTKAPFFLQFMRGYTSPVFALNQTQMFATRFRRKRVSS